MATELRAPAETEDGRALRLLVVVLALAETGRLLPLRLAAVGDRFPDGSS
jgi:hypothetical protein